MLAKNLKYLRKKHKISQAEMASILGLKRTALGDYERSTSNPSISTLLQIASYFDISIDQLLKDKIYNDEYTVINAPELKVLAITVDLQNNNLIDLVRTKAEAGYLSSYEDPEYIRELPKIGIPNIPEGTYRAFEINGDSMNPINSGSIIICSYVEQIEDIKNNKTHIVISKMEGLVFKRVVKDLKNNRLILSSDNPHYLPYEMKLEDVNEIWSYYAHLSFSDAKPEIESIKSKLEGVSGYLDELKEHINKL